MADALADRRRHRHSLIELARTYVEGVSARLPVLAAAVAGSVARGDFNVWSDIDVVVVAPSLPDRVPDRAGVLGIDAPPGVQAVGFTPDEFAAAVAKRNRLATEAVDAGIVLRGEEFFRTLRA
ncbi:MAG: nucleotidyltransferase domain-containing protein [Actinomycetota bacterium]|nr:nucleotidyltransferase domain-containing protein [Actinomycetota bacterium]